MIETQQLVRAELSEGLYLYIEASPVGPASDRQDVADRTRQFPFKQITDSVEAIAREFATALNRARPTKATIQFGCELAAEPGQLVVMLVKGTAKANLTITLEWTNSRSSPPA